MTLSALHHVTCVCSDAQRTVDFYRDELGFSLVKKTVNFDDPHSYHLYFGDGTGKPGSLITFFEWPRAERGRLGRGTLESIGLAIPELDAGLFADDAPLHFAEPVEETALIGAGTTHHIAWRASSDEEQEAWLER